VFENTIFKKTFGPKREVVTGDWRQLHNEELHYLYTSLDVTQVIKLRGMRREGGGACGTYCEKEKGCTGIGGKT
jgi:hypothetical protein